jgi:hypothetical protein
MNILFLQNSGSPATVLGYQKSHKAVLNFEDIDFIQVF